MPVVWPRCPIITTGRRSSKPQGGRSGCGASVTLLLRARPRHACGSRGLPDSAGGIVGKRAGRAPSRSGNAARASHTPHPTATGCWQQPARERTRRAPAAAPGSPDDDQEGHVSGDGAAVPEHPVEGLVVDLRRCVRERFKPPRWAAVFWGSAAALGGPRRSTDITSSAG